MDKAALMDDFSSSRLQNYLKHQIYALKSYIHTERLKPLLRCGTVGDIKKGVTILSNGETSRIVGVRLCQHSWCCPHCTAQKMAKYRKRISAGIDALAKQKKSAIMITFTIFHTIKQNCNQSFKILRRTWELFNKTARWRRKRATGPHKNTTNKPLADDQAFYMQGGAWCNFTQHFNITHNVKALEATYGKHGWHPHMHILYFVDNSKLNEVLQWEDQLLKRWLVCEDKAAREILTAEQYEIRKFLYSKETRPDAEHKALYISRDEDTKTNTEKIKVFHSGDYICGWGGDSELTGTHLKQARGTNYTPIQLLEESYNLQITNPKKSRKLLFTFLNFAETIISERIHRIDFSRTGLKAIIQNQLNSEEYKETYKKKCQQLNIKPYKTICWIPGITWLNIHYIDNRIAPIKFLIKIFATYDNGYALISELFEIYNLPPPLKEHPSDKDFWAEWFNERIFAQAA